MKTTLFICSVLSIALRVHGATLPPADSFRLTVEDVVQSAHCRVVTLKIEVRSAEMMAIRYQPGAEGSVPLAPAPKGKGREGRVIVASILGERGAVGHTSIALQSHGAEAGAQASYDLAPDAKLDSVVSVTVTNGLYKLDRPLLIGTRNGGPMRLVVGKWNQASVAAKP